MANPACGKNDLSAAQPPLDEASREEIENWGYEWLTAVENRHRLDSWDQQSDILLILPPADTQNIADYDMAALAILRGTLEYWYHYYQTQATQDHLALVETIEMAANSDDARNPLPNRAHDGTCKTRSAFFNRPLSFRLPSFHLNHRTDWTRW